MSSDAETVIRYDGPALAGHEIDVRELAPALLALADMIQLANRRFNGEGTSMKVTVRADVKQQCFMLHIHIAQSILESARHLFSTDGYKTAKEIAEALDLIFPAGFGGGVFMIWKYFAKKKGEAPSMSQFVTDQRGGTTVINNFYADGASATVQTANLELATDPEMIELGKKVMAPLERAGYDSLAFFCKGEPVVEINKPEAVGFRALPTPEVAPQSVPEEDAVHTPIRGRASIITRRDEGKAQWGIKWAGKVEWVSMPDDWLADYQGRKIDVPVGSWLDVTIEMTTSRINPDASPTYKVLVVHSVISPGPIVQEALL